MHRRAANEFAQGISVQTNKPILEGSLAVTQPSKRLSLILVTALVVSGLLNKQVGGELGISEITVKAHRGEVTRKMKGLSR
jgi:DNA-binding NarL/FixJ family response regulator